MSQESTTPEPAATQSQPLAPCPGDEALRAIQEELVGEIDGSIDRLEFVHTDDALREHLDVLRATLKAHVSAYLGHLMARRATLTPHTSVMYAEAVGAPGVVATTFRGLLDAGALSAEQGARLMQFIRDHRTMLIFGDRRAGKSTLLNALFEFASVDERFVAIENGPDLPALRDRSFCVRLAVDADTDLPALFSKARRMNPSRLVIGELRAAEVRDFFGLLTGPARIAGMSTLRAATVSKALEAIAVGFGGDAQYARELVAEARPVFVQMHRDGGDLPRLMAIWSVEGLADGELVLREIESAIPLGRGLLAEV